MKMKWACGALLVLGTTVNASDLSLGVRYQSGEEFAKVSVRVQGAQTHIRYKLTASEAKCSVRMSKGLLEPLSKTVSREVSTDHPCSGRPTHTSAIIEDLAEFLVSDLRENPFQAAFILRLVRSRGAELY